ncbi:MAG: hypothetical protein M3167_08215 [Acidobacteriota bacterium]|nr:hypothetical protein [Acidobacteriota bacterium]
MSSELKWTLGVGLTASFRAAVLAGLITRMNILSLFGWFVFIELLQLPMIASARRGHIDPCTAWLRRVLGGKQSAA